jgi:hypothetical protein
MGVVFLDGVAVTDISLHFAPHPRYTLIRKLSMKVTRTPCTLWDNIQRCEKRQASTRRTVPAASTIDLRSGGSGDEFVVDDCVVYGFGGSRWLPVWGDVPSSLMVYTNNLIIGGGENWPCFELQNAHSIYNNSAAGCAGVAYENIPARHGWNVAHNNLRGVDIDGTTQVVRNFTLWRSNEFAIYTIVSNPYPDESLIINVSIADSNNGIYVSQTTMYAAMRRAVGSQIQINGSLIVGYSRFRRSFGCGQATNATGIWMPFLGTELGASGGGACRCCCRKPAPLESPAGLVKQGEVKMTDLTFGGFQDTCDPVNFAMRVNPNCLDHNTPAFFRSIDWHEVDEPHKLYMPPTDPRHINLGGCWTMVPDYDSNLTTPHPTITSSLTSPGPRSSSDRTVAGSLMPYSPTSTAA